MSRAPVCVGRGGFAVVAVLLLLIGLMGLAHGALLLAERERIASGLEARLLSRRLAARAAARPPEGTDTLPTLGRTAIPLGGGRRELLRWRTDGVGIGRELVLLVGVAALEGLPGEDRVGALAAVLDPSARAARAAAVVEAGGGADVGADGVTASGWLAPDAAQAAACTAELRALDSLGAVAPPPLAALPPAAVPVLPGLGAIPGDTLLARVAGRIAATATPQPREWLGACVPGLLNWGSPSDPTGPCGTRWVLRAADRDLLVRGGEGQGVLIVAGSLTLADGARFDGVALVGGDLTVVRGATLAGMARVAGLVRVRDGGRVVGSACAVARAIRASAPLRRPWLLPGLARVHPL